MQKDPFVVLGVSENVSQSQLYEAYKKEREKYAEKRFAPGEEGTIACERLDEIEQAYNEAYRILQESYYITNYDNPYQGVEDMIKGGKIEEAQLELDKIQNRDANWHYLQAMVFYRKRWFNEAREQLRTAMSKDPNNTKYSDAYNNLNEKLKSDTSHNAHNSFYGADPHGRSYRGTNADRVGTARGCTPCDCCTSLLCADCCCECMGGDLISCC